MYIKIVSPPPFEETLGLFLTEGHNRIQNGVLRTVREIRGMD